VSASAVIPLPTPAAAGGGTTRVLLSASGSGWHPPPAELMELVRRAQEDDDAAAWEALYRATYPGLLAYARGRLWGRTEADDAVSETFARAYRRIGDFQWTGGGFVAWLYGILRNVVLEAQRSNRRVNLTVAPDQREEDDSLDAVILDEEAAAVRAAFASLSPFDQEVLELRIIGDLAAEEVAEVIGKRPGAVRMAQSRALARLRIALGKVASGG
jgi:RNA polymerase sigma-70 factor (ECF subfamily)